MTTGSPPPDDHPPTSPQPAPAEPSPDARPAVVALLAGLFHFCLLGGYYMLRPVRDEIGASQREVLEQLWTATFFAVAIATPLYTVVIARVRREVFLPLVYLFLVINLGLFFMLLQPANPEFRGWIERIFYVWASVVNLLAVSVFWSFVSDLFTAEQSKSWFGPIAAGGTIGAIAGSLAVERFAETIGRTPWLLIGGGMWLLAAACIWPMARLSTRRPQRRVVPHGSAIAEIAESFISAGTGLLKVIRSPYLLGISGFILLLALGNSFLYFEKAWLTGEAIVDRAARTAFMARIDLGVNVTTVLLQGGVVVWLMRLLGVGWTLALLPMINLLGFLLLGLFMFDDLEGLKRQATLLLGLLIAFEIAQRVGRYALARPSRESLFTVVDHQERYQSKAFIDTVVYRGGDTVGAWAFAGLTKGLAFSLGAAALVSTPFFAAGIILSLWLGARQRARAAADSDE